MKVPQSMPELRMACAQIMAGAINGDVRLDEGRLALNAATRIIESVQAETRARALAHAIGSSIPESMPLTIGAFAIPAAQIEGHSGEE